MEKSDAEKTTHQETNAESKSETKADTSIQKTSVHGISLESLQSLSSDDDATYHDSIDNVEENHTSNNYQTKESTDSGLNNYDVLAKGSDIGAKVPRLGVQVTTANQGDSGIQDDIDYGTQKETIGSDKVKESGSYVTGGGDVRVGKFNRPTGGGVYRPQEQINFVDSKPDYKVVSGPRLVARGGLASNIPVQRGIEYNSNVTASAISQTNGIVSQGSNHTDDQVDHSNNIFDGPHRSFYREKAVESFVITPALNDDGTSIVDGRQKLDGNENSDELQTIQNTNVNCVNTEVARSYTNVNLVNKHRTDIVNTRGTDYVDNPMQNVNQGRSNPDGHASSDTTADVNNVNTQHGYGASVNDTDLFSLKSDDVISILSQSDDEGKQIRLSEASVVNMRNMLGSLTVRCNKRQGKLDRIEKLLTKETHKLKVYISRNADKSEERAIKRHLRIIEEMITYIREENADEDTWNTERGKQILASLHISNHSGESKVEQSTVLGGSMVDSFSQTYEMLPNNNLVETDAGSPDILSESVKIPVQPESRQSQPSDLSVNSSQALIAQISVPADSIPSVCTENSFSIIEPSQRTMDNIVPALPGYDTTHLAEKVRDLQAELDMMRDNSLKQCEVITDVTAERDDLAQQLKEAPTVALNAAERQEIIDLNRKFKDASDKLIQINGVLKRQEAALIAFMKTESMAARPFAPRYAQSHSVPVKVTSPPVSASLTLPPTKPKLIDDIQAREGRLSRSLPDFKQPRIRQKAGKSFPGESPESGSVLVMPSDILNQLDDNGRRQFYQKYAEEEFHIMPETTRQESEETQPMGGNFVFGTGNRDAHIAGGGSIPSYTSTISSPKSLNSPNDPVQESMDSLQDRTCPVCRRTFSRMSVDLFQTHVFECADEKEEVVEQKSDDDDDKKLIIKRSCPVCHIAYTLSLLKFEAHVDSHFH